MSSPEILTFFSGNPEVTDRGNASTRGESRLQAEQAGRPSLDAARHDSDEDGRDDHPVSHAAGHVPYASEAYYFYPYLIREGPY